MRHLVSLILFSFYFYSTECGKCFVPTTKKFSPELQKREVRKITSGHAKLLCESYCAQIATSNSKKKAKDELNDCTGYHIDPITQSCYLFEKAPLETIKSKKITYYDNKCSQTALEILSLQDKIALNIFPPSSTTPSTRSPHLYGVDHVIDEILFNISLSLHHNQLFSSLTSPHKSFLLYGPPGNGKTILSQLIAQRLSHDGVHLIALSMSSITSNYNGESEKLIELLFTIAEEIKPVILFFDEVDSFLEKRTEHTHDALLRMKNQFLVNMDKIQDNPKIFLIAATNFPYKIDDAVMRRLVLKYYLPLPNAKDRLQLLQKLIRVPNVMKYGGVYPLMKEMTEKEMIGLAGRMEGYSSKDIFDIVSDVFEKIMDSERENIMRRPVNGDFVEVLKRRLPTVSVEYMRQLSGWEERIRKGREGAGRG